MLNKALDIESILTEKFPKLSQKKTGQLTIKMIKALSHEAEINGFIEQNQHLRGFAFLDAVLRYFNFSYKTSAQAIERIPSQGRVVIIANHPIGSLDGLALLKMVRSVRADVRIVANDLLNTIQPLQSLFLGVDTFNKSSSHKTLFKNMREALENDEALIIFPAGEVSRIAANGVRDAKWQNGFIKLAKKTQSPILPIYIDAQNSSLFYALSALYKPLGTMMLVKEMFNKSHQQIEFYIGNPIPYKEYSQFDDLKALNKRFRKHLYRLAKESKSAKKGKQPLFQCEQTIAHPVNSKALKKELKKSQLLGTTQDNKTIYLFDNHDDSVVMQEIGRLRELTFRTVEEGTGEASDVDAYDSRYRHLVLWDEEELEIVGAYRLGICADLTDNGNNFDALYTSTLFNLKKEMADYLPYAIELGRSFVQPKYWGKRSLDYLWYGIGAYVAQNPHIRYLFGPVSLSDAYPQNAKELIIEFYQRQFGSKQDLAKALRPVKISQTNQLIGETLFTDDYKHSYKKLNNLLELDGVKVPPLFKQYAEVCDDKGCRFIDFSIDPDFGNCIDALILVDLQKLTAKKRARYIDSNIEKIADSAA